MQNSPPRPCASLPAWRRLHVAAGPAAFPVHLEGDGCLREVLGRFSSAYLGFVVTWSLGGREARDARRSRFGGMTGMHALYGSRADVGLQVYARGASCSQLTASLSDWVNTGRGACVDGPNLGAREAHTVLRFAEEYYAHLPEVVVFTQVASPLISSLPEGFNTGGYTLTRSVNPVSPVPCPCSWPLASSHS